MRALGVAALVGMVPRVSPAAGPPFQISESPTGITPAVAGGRGGQFMVVWQGHDGGVGITSTSDAGIGGRRVVGTTPQGRDFVVNATTAETQGAPDVAWLRHPNRFGVVWTVNQGSYGDMIAKQYASDGTVAVADYTLNDTPLANRAPAGIASGGTLGQIIVWNDVFPAVAVFAERGEPGTTDLPVFSRAATPQPGDRVGAPALAVNDWGIGGVVVVWPVRLYMVDQSWRVVGRRLDVEEDDVFDIASGDPDPDHVAIASDAPGYFFVIWTDAGWPRTNEGNIRDSDLRGRAYDPAGRPLGPAFRVNTTTPGRQDYPQVAAGYDDELMVVWESSTERRSEIRGRRFDRRGVPRGDDFPVASPPGDEAGFRRPDVASDTDGNFLVVWDRRGRREWEEAGIYGRRYPRCDPMADEDGDGHCTADDNCPAAYNPDQRDADGVGGGDLCDACPASDSGCNASMSGAGTIGSAGGTLTRGTVTVEVPEGAVGGDTSFTITDVAGSEYGIGGSMPVADVVQLGPDGTTFEPPVVLTLGWTDTGNGDVAGVSPRLRERNLVVYKNGAAITRACDHSECQPGRCEQSNQCGVGQLAGVYGVCCDQPRNTWTLPLSSFSEIALAGERCAPPLVDRCEPGRSRSCWQRLLDWLHLDESCCVRAATVVGARET